MGKSEIIDHDPTPIWLNKFQKELAKSRKEKKFENETYFKLNTSGAIPPRSREKLSYGHNSVNYRNCIIQNIKIFS